MSVAGELPRELPLANDWRALVREVVLAAALVGIVNAAAGAHLRAHPVNFATAIVREKWRLVRVPHPPLGTLVLGDSSANQGVDTRLVAERTGAPALNLATIANYGTPGDSWMLATFLAGHPAPRRVLIVHTYDAWRRDVATLENVLARLPPPVDVDELEPRIPWTLRQRARFAWHHQVVNRFPLYAENESIAWLLARPRRLRTGRGFVFDASGYAVRPHAKPGEVLGELAQQAAVARRARFEPKPLQVIGLETVVERARRAGAAVYLAPAPICACALEDEAMRRALDAVGTFLEGFAVARPGVRLLFRDAPAVPLEEMEGLDHVAEAGAARYTAAVLDAIARFEAPSG